MSWGALNRKVYAMTDCVRDGNKITHSNSALLLIEAEQLTLIVLQKHWIEDVRYVYTVYLSIYSTDEYKQIIAEYMEMVANICF